MSDQSINLTGIFERYTPIDMQPYYVFTTEHRYLVRCEDYPELIGELSPSTKVNIKGGIGAKLSQGIELLNVKWSLSNDK